MLFLFLHAYFSVPRRFLCSGLTLDSSECDFLTEAVRLHRSLHMYARWRVKRRKCGRCGVNLKMICVHCVVKQWHTPLCCGSIVSQLMHVLCLELGGKQSWEVGTSHGLVKVKIALNATASFLTSWLAWPFALCCAACFWANHTEG